MSELHPNTLRVIAAARDAGLEITTRRFPEGTKTAADAAAAIGVTVGQIVKSLVFGVDNEIVMALVSGSNQLDENDRKQLTIAEREFKFRTFFENEPENSIAAKIHRFYMKCSEISNIKEEII